MNLSRLLPLLAASMVQAQTSSEQAASDLAERIMRARFHLQESFDRDLSAKVPVSQLNLPPDAASRFDLNGDGFVVFDEIERIESASSEPEVPRDRSGFTFLQEEGFPLNLEPEIVRADEAPIQDEDIVMGIVVNGEARAYPVNYMNGPYNEVVNDNLGGEAIAPSW